MDVFPDGFPDVFPEVDMSCPQSKPRAFEGSDQGSISRCQQIFWGFLLLVEGRHPGALWKISKISENELGWNLQNLHYSEQPALCTRTLS